MPLIFVTGISTSGKSSVAKELTKLGYEAYDTERNGISAYFNKKTGQRAADFGEAPERSADWLAQHHWLISKEWVSQKAQETKDKVIFLCGGSSNDSEIRELCDVVIWLQTDELTIRDRVKQPRDHDYGTRPHELAKSIEGNIRKEADYKAYGAVLIDARKPMAIVIEEILCAVE